MGYGYRELRVWDRAMSLAKSIYQLSADFPGEERFGLTSQVRRAAVSVPSNIAEGQGRATRGEFQQFLGTARGSLYELQTQIEPAHALGHVGASKHEQFSAQSSEVAKLLNALIVSMRSNNTTRNTKQTTRNN